jgi:hypothetical protein
MRARATAPIALAALAALALSAASCDGGFAPASELTAVRVLAIRSDTPYVRPGATFTAEMLAYDGRLDPPSPMRLYWLKDVCLSPKGGEPGDCYRRFAGAYATDQDLTPFVDEGRAASFQMPADAGDVEAGPGLPTALVFGAACAGRLRFVGVAAAYPDRSPFGCFDERGRRVGDEGFVFAFFRLFVSNDLVNANPTPAAVTLDGVPLPANEPFPLAACAAADVDDCPARKLGVAIGDEQQELDPTSAAPGAAPRREQVWSNFFVSRGKLESEALVLFDGKHGRVPGVTNDFRGPREAGDVDLFVITRDDRSGVTFQAFKLRSE